jgi:hypothetical protein
METSSTEIRNSLKEVWPDLKHIWLTDHVYYVPTFEELREEILKHDVRDLPYIENLNECEEYSLFLHAAVKKELVHTRKFNYTISFGEAIGQNIETAFSKVHKLNIAITEQGVFLVEPQSYQIVSVKGRIQKNDRNYIFYVTM